MGLRRRPGLRGRDGYAAGVAAAADASCARETATTRYYSSASATARGLCQHVHHFQARALRDFHSTRHGRNIDESYECILYTKYIIYSGVCITTQGYISTKHGRKIDISNMLRKAFFEQRMDGQNEECTYRIYYGRYNLNKAWAEFRRIAYIIRKIIFNKAWTEFRRVVYTQGII